MNTEHPHVALVRRYYKACNSADADAIKATFTDDVVHYFTHHEPIVGAENLAGYFVKMQPRVNGEWFVDHALVDDDECVIEWTMSWDAPSGKRELIRGSEWYLIRDGRLAEIRAYYLNPHLPHEPGNFELKGFPYEARGFAM